MKMYGVAWPMNSWRPMIVTADVKQAGVPFNGTRAVVHRCWREISREVHLKRFGRYPA